MPISRTCSSRPPTATTTVSPSITSTTLARPSWPVPDAARHPTTRRQTRTSGRTPVVPTGTGPQPRSRPCERAPSGRFARTERVGSEALDDGAGAETATAAHRHEAVAAAAALELVQGLGHEERARGAERVAEGDGAAVRVGLREVGADLLGPRQDDGGERLVDLERVHLVDGQPAALEQALG